MVDRRRACATSYDDNDGIGDDEERATTRPFDSSCRVAGQASPFSLVAALLTYPILTAVQPKERNCITSYGKCATGNRAGNRLCSKTMVI